MGRKYLISNTISCTAPFRHSNPSPKMLSRAPQTATRRTGQSSPRMAPRRGPETAELREVWAIQRVRRGYHGRGTLARSSAPGALRALSGYRPAPMTRCTRRATAGQRAPPGPMSLESPVSSRAPLLRQPGRRRGQPCAHEGHRPDGRGSAYRSSRASGGHESEREAWQRAYWLAAHGLRRYQRKTTAGQQRRHSEPCTHPAKRPHVPTRRPATGERLVYLTPIGSVRNRRSGTAARFPGRAESARRSCQRRSSARSHSLLASLSKWRRSGTRHHLR